MSDLSVLHTKLNPPRSPRHTLARPRVEALLRQALDYRLSLVQASTGYGKSTALGQLLNTGMPLFWYTVSEGDADPQQFLAHLITSFRLGLPALADTPLALLQETYPGNLRAALDALLNTLNDCITAPSLVVIDDYHFAAPRSSSDIRPVASEGFAPTVGTLMDRFIRYLPNELHIILSSRYPLDLEGLVTWRARGQVLELKREALAFTPPEIAALFREKYNSPLSPLQIDVLADKTEGWPIALQLVWQEMRTKPSTDLGLLLGAGSPSLDTLFEYLARNVLVQQPGQVQEFLLGTSILRELDAEACQALVTCDCHAILDFLLEHDLFVTVAGHAQSDPSAQVDIEGAQAHYRYHHLFHDFLREQAARKEPERLRERHLRAAQYYRDAGNPDEAIYHLHQASAFDESAILIEQSGESMLRAGRLDTLAGWMDVIPPEIVATRPLLMFYLGDLARLRSRFEEALAWYKEAERVWRSMNDASGVARALRGEALVYLDTVRPAHAEDLLEQALRIYDGLDDRVTRARLLELLAENKLNMGKAGEAEQLRAQARTWRAEGPSEDVLGVRVKLRTGKLDEAREVLQAWAEQERGQAHAPRAHRETLLILALVHAMQGHAEEALATAREGLEVAAQLGSPFVSAVGQMRLGHARQICGDLDGALHSYELAVQLGDRVAVRRTRAEAMWGMTRAHGYAGDLEAARRAAAEGCEIGRNAGDVWIVALIQVALGASLVRAHKDREAIQVLGDALADFRSCADTFGETAARLWLALGYWQANQRERAMSQLEQALALVQAHHYEYVVTQRTLLGWDDARVVVPLLLEMQKRVDTRPALASRAIFAIRLLAAMGLSEVAVHPGYQVRIQTLGPLRVWRGDEEIAPQDWKRRKARELLELLVTFRGKWLEREQIFEFLWSGEAPATAARDFKVALNALMNVLEPERAPNEPSAFIARQDTAYGLRTGADVEIDAEEFIRSLSQAEETGDLETFSRALALYQDDYLAADARYAEWASAERERLLASYLRAADRLAAELLVQSRYDECIYWCEKILSRDRCWEHAYRLMMRAFSGGGNQAQAQRVFDRCAHVLREELDVEPSAATMEVWQEILARPG